MADVINLDKLLPEPKEVEISGRIVKVYPGKLKVLIKIQKAFTAFKGAVPEKQVELMEGLIEVLSKIMPNLKDEDMDISIEQLPALVNIAYESSLPEKIDLVKKNNMNITPNVEKKTQITSVKP